jgi:hypothetical protein
MKAANHMQGQATMAIAKVLVAAALVSFGPLTGAQTAMNSAASAMQAGEWRVLNRGGDASGFNNDLLKSCTGTDCADNILNFADKGLWNPATREMHFIGKGHMREAKHIVYSEATNRWSQEPLPSWAGGQYGLGHGYEHSTIDPATGRIYARTFNTGDFFRWDRATKQWSSLPSGPNSAVAAALQWFPDMGALLFVGGGQIHAYSESTSSWRSLATGLTMGGYHNAATYNPVYKVAIVGGGNGSRAVYKVAANGSVARIADAPAGVGVSSSVLTTDPASGKMLLFSSGGGLFEYDVPTDRWSTLSSSIPLWAPDSNKIIYRIAIPVATHGVIAFLTHYWNDASSQVFLYKHSPGLGTPADTTPPAPPSGVRLQ